MRIGIFGSGRIGATLARAWLRTGHEVRFGARDPERTARKADAMDPRLTAGTIEETADWGEAFLLAVPLHATPAVGGAAGKGLVGKPVLDAGNAIPERDGAAAEEAKRAGTGIWVSRHLPGALVVKAFNTVYFETIAAGVRADGARVGVPLAGDSEEALAVAERLVRDAGLDPLRIGGLSESSRIDYGSPVWNSDKTAGEIREALD